MLEQLSTQASSGVEGASQPKTTLGASETVARSSVKHSASEATSSGSTNLDPKLVLPPPINSGRNDNKESAEAEWSVWMTKNKPPDKIYEFLFSQPLGKLRYVFLLDKLSIQFMLNINSAD